MHLSDPRSSSSGVDNLFAAQAIGDVLQSKIYSGILPRIVDG